MEREILNLKTKETIKIWKTSKENCLPYSSSPIVLYKITMGPYNVTHNSMLEEQLNTKEHRLNVDNVQIHAHTSSKICLTNYWEWWNTTLEARHYWVKDVWVRNYYVDAKGCILCRENALTIHIASPVVFQI